ncbi:MAG: RNA polymerase factor sigma-32 [Deltaproteobacteria bacterium]|nr:RNA polymerase factor sigma-32 [Candidatus Anaeroferrophillus wilburensis]MBN2889315.1 RNA polymerase factor sigma-32 [Deltaproteobacteria bacterium]
MAEYAPAIPVTDSLSLYMAEINRFPLLKPDEEYSLAVRYRQAGELEAAHKLVVSNLRFVVKIASEYDGYRIKKMDLIQEGNLGLMTAVKKFNPERGYRLISYAVWWIRAYIRDFIMRSWSLVKIGTTQLQKKLFYKLSQIKGSLEGNEIDRQSMRALMDGQHDDEKVQALYQRLSHRDLSLDHVVSEGETTYLDMLVDEGQDQERSLIALEEQQRLQQKIRQAIARLTKRERQVVEGRFFSSSPKTLQEVGDSLGITRERVRQLENNAKKKLKHYLEMEFGDLLLAA